MRLSKNADWPSTILPEAGLMNKEYVLGSEGRLPSGRSARQFVRRIRPACDDDGFAVVVGILDDLAKPAGDGCIDEGKRGWVIVGRLHDQKR